MGLGARVVARYPALGAPLYRRYWLASLGSVGGWQMANIAMGWHVYDLTQSELALGILGAATAIPAVLLTLVGGVLADRFEKRRLLLATTFANTLLLALLAVLDAAGQVNEWHLWAVAGGISIVSGIDWPARQSFFVHLIDRQGLVSAVALNSVLWQVTRMVLPAVGGLMIARFDTAIVYSLAAAGYGVMFWVLAGFSLRLPGERSTSPWQQTRAGIAYVLQEPIFRQLIGLSYAMMLFVSAFMQVMPAFAAALGAGPTGFGVLMSATGIGSIAGTLLAGSLPVGAAYGRVLLAAAAIAALLLLGFAAAVALGGYWLALGFAVLGATGTSVFLIFSTTALQAAVPDALRGRVMGIHGITYSLMPLGALLIGALAKDWGVAMAYALSLTVFLLILGLVVGRSPQIRGLAAPDPG